MSFSSDLVSSMLARSPAAGLLRGLDLRDGWCVPAALQGGHHPPCAGGRERGEEGGIHRLESWAGPSLRTAGHRAEGLKDTPY